MAAPDQSSIEQQISSLRAELKDWEKTFSDANGGRKAGRDDIKKDPTIATKYKTYSKLRSQAPSFTTSKSDHDRGHQIEGHSNKKRVYPFPDQNESHKFATPRKLTKHLPLNPKNGEVHISHPSRLDPYESPSNIKNILLSPNSAVVSPLPFRAVIGPTPQRDGKALGLFDLLSPSGLSTPSSRRQSKPRIRGESTPSRSRVLKTPSKGGESAGRSRRHSLTPASSAKKFYLSNFFATPSTMRYATIVEADEGEDEDGLDIPSQSGPMWKKEGPEPETPSFLRRTNVLFTRPTTQRENESDNVSPVAVRMPQKVVGKGLSQLVQGLRDMEDEMIEDDMDALREAEAAEAEAEAEAEADGQSLDDNVVNPDSINSPSRVQKQWKKKGQKRTTKLVYLRPLRGKPQGTTEPAIPEESSEDESSAVSQTRVVPPVDGNGPDEDDSNADSKDKPASKEEAQRGNKLVQKVRKIKATAHANYRALKIRSKNSKGKGRFGRRR